MAGLYVAGLLVFLEVVARVTFSIGPLQRRLDGSDDASHRMDWLRQRSNRQEFVYGFDVHHPTRGWAVAPNVSNMVVFGDRILNSNARGVRGRVEHPYERQPGRRRILTFGDSFTFGDEVSDDETYSAALGRLLPDTEVINLGVHGYGHDQMLVYLQEEGVKYRPDVVILGYVWFDAQRNRFTFNNYAKPKFDLRDGRLSLATGPIPGPDWFVRNEIYRSRLVDVGVILDEKVRVALGWIDGEARTLTTAILQAFAGTVRGIGALPTFVYLPVLGELNNHDPALTPNEQYLSETCETLDVTCLFLRPAFVEAAQGGMRLNTRAHWLAQEHAIAAQRLKAFLDASARPVTAP